QDDEKDAPAPLDEAEDRPHDDVDHGGDQQADGVGENLASARSATIHKIADEEQDGPQNAAEHEAQANHARCLVEESALPAGLETRQPRAHYGEYSGHEQPDEGLENRAKSHAHSIVRGTQQKGRTSGGPT